MRPTFLRQPPAWVPLLWGLERWRHVCFAALAALYVLGMNGRWRITADGALHVQAARSIAEGQGFAQADGLHEAMSPGLAYALAWIGAEGVGIEPWDGWRAQVFMLVVAGLTLTVTYRWLKLHARRATATLITLLVGLSTLYHEMAFSLLTELPFTLGLMLVLWGHERRERRGGRGRRGEQPAAAWLLIGLGFAVMMAFRSVALVVLAAYLLNELIAALRDARRRGAAVTAAGACIGAAVLLWFCSSAVREDAALFVAHLRTTTLASLWANLDKLMGEVLGEAVVGQALPPYVAWPVSVGVMVAAVALWRVRPLWAVLWVVLVAQWLVFLVDIRYVLPMLPVLYYGLWRATVSVSMMPPPRWGNAMFTTVMVCWIGANVFGFAYDTATQRSGDFYGAYRRGRYKATVEVGRWLREHTAGDAVVALRPAEGGAWTQELAALSRRRVVDAGAGEGSVDYVVEPMGAGEQAGWALLLVEDGRRAGVVWVVRGGGVDR